MRIIAELLKGRTGRFIGAGGAGVYARHNDPRWGPLGPPILLAEDAPRCDDPAGPKFNHLMWVTEETLMRAHREGHYSATYFRYPSLYGAHAPANPDWSVVRRILDGRKRLIVPANGVLKRRGAARNVAHALLLAVDKPAESGGQIYNIRDERQYTQRQYVAFIARHLKHDCEIVEVPPLLAEKVYKGGASQPRWMVEFDDAGAIGVSATNDVVIKPLFISSGASWKYLDNGSDQGTAWRARSFNDGAWASGPAQLGFGDGDEATVVAGGPAAPRFCRRS